MRRRTAAAYLVVLALLTGSLLAATPAGPRDAAGHATASLLHVDAIDIASDPLGPLGALSVADLDVGHTAAAGRSGGLEEVRDAFRRRLFGTSTGVPAASRAAVVDVDTPIFDLGDQGAATATAPPARSSRQDEAVTVPGVVSTSAASTAADADWPRLAPCLRHVSSSSHVADVSLLEALPGLDALLRSDGISRSTSTLDVVRATAGPAVRSRSTTELAPLTLLAGTPAETTVRVVGAGSVSATADGLGTSEVSYDAPIVRVENAALPGGAVELGDAGLDLPLSGAVGLPFQTLRLELGTLTDVTRTGDGTLAAGVADTFRIRLLGGVLGGVDVSVGHQEARAEAPVGGIECGRSNTLDLVDDCGVAHATAEVLHLDALTIPGVLRAADLDVGTADAAVDAQGLREVRDAFGRVVVERDLGREAAASAGIADARALRADGLGDVVRLDEPLGSSADASPSERDRDRSVLDLRPLVAADLLDTSAFAAWSDSRLLPRAAGASTELTDLALLSGRVPGIADLLVIDDVSRSRADARNVRTSTGVATRSVATTNLAPVRLLAGTPAETTIRVAGEAVLEAVADGRGRADLRYTEPVVTVESGLIPGGRATLDAAGIDLRLPVGVGPFELLELRLGTLEDTGTASDGTVAAGVADTVRLRLVSLSPALSPTVELALGHQEVRAEAPAGGFDCGLTPPGGGDTSAGEASFGGTTIDTPPTVSPGGTFPVIVTVPNDGADATGVTAVIELDLPPGTTISSDDPRVAVNDGVVTAALGDLDAGRVTAVDLDVSLPADATPGTATEVSVTVDARVDGIDVSHEESATGPTVAAPEPGAGLTVEASATPDEVAPGDSYGTTITVGNPDAAATGTITVSQPIPDGARLAGCEDCEVVADTVTWRIAPLSPGSSAAVSARFDVEDTTAPGTDLDVVVEASDESSSDAAETVRLDAPTVVPRGGAGSEGSQAPASTAFDRTEITDPEEVAAGGSFEVVVTAPNDGSTDATDVEVRATVDLPAGATVTPLTDRATADGASVTLLTGPLAPGDVAELRFRVDVPADVAPGTRISTSSEVSGQVDGGRATARDGSAGPVVRPSGAGSGDTGNAQLDRSRLTHSPDDVQPGDRASYVVELSNDADDATGPLRLVQVIPQGTTLVDCGGCTDLGGGRVQWEVGDLPAGSSVTRVLTVSVDADTPPGTRLPSRARVTGDDTDLTLTTDGPRVVADDPAGGSTGGDDGTGEPGIDPQAALEPSTVVWPDEAHVGATTGAVAVVTNAGQSTLSDAVATVSVDLPAGAVLRTEAPGASVDGGRVTFPVGSLPPEASIALPFQVVLPDDAPRGGRLPTSIEVTATGPTGQLAATRDLPGPRVVAAGEGPADTSATVVTTAPDEVTPGVELVYVVQLPNDGGADAGPRTVLVELPRGSAVLDCGGCTIQADGRARFDVDDVAAGDTLALPVRVQLGDEPDAGGYGARVTVVDPSDEGAGADQPETVGTTDGPVVAEPAGPETSPIGLDEAVVLGPEDANAGGATELVLVLANPTDTTLSDGRLVVELDLPTGATVTTPVDGAVIDGGQVSFPVDTLAPGGAVALPLTVVFPTDAPVGHDIDLAVELVGVDEDGATVRDVRTIAGPPIAPPGSGPADLGDSSIVVGPERAGPGDDVVYGIVIPNDGGDAAGPVDVVATLPPGATLTGCPGDCTVSDDGTVTIRLEDLPGNDTATLPLTVRLPDGEVPEGGYPVVAEIGAGGSTVVTVRTDGPRPVAGDARPGTSPRGDGDGRPDLPTTGGGLTLLGLLSLAGAAALRRR